MSTPERMFRGSDLYTQKVPQLLKGYLKRIVIDESQKIFVKIWVVLRWGLRSRQIVMSYFRVRVQQVWVWVSGRCSRRLHQVSGQTHPGWDVCLSHIFNGLMAQLQQAVLAILNHFHFFSHCWEGIILSLLASSVTDKNSKCYCDSFSFDCVWVLVFALYSGSF